MTLKQKFQNLLFPLHSIQKIRLGYLKGHKIRLSENSLWSPLIGNWEPSIQKIMVNIVKTGDVAYDLGANNGLHGLLLSLLVGKNGFVYNFEPFEENVLEIIENFELNGLTNYKNIVAAISDFNGNAKFEIASHFKQGKLTNVVHNSNFLNVEVKSLDELINSGIQLPKFIKMDIEGAEGKALNGFTKNIEKCFPDMIIELHSPEQDIEVGKFLKFYNYTAFRFDPFKKLKFTEIKNFDRPFPYEDGIWGSLLCLGPKKIIKSLSFNK